MLKFLYLLPSAAMLLLPHTVCRAQTGTPAEPVRYVGGEIANPNLHDGGLRYVVGVENIQVVRANRTDPSQSDGFGWTYNHAPDLTYWNGKFYLQYLSNPVNEHEDPGHTLLVVSEDGRNWGRPEVCFPAYRPPQGVSVPEGYNGYMMHQRMGFYTAPDGRLLTVAFYGHTENPFKEGGIGRVVREIYRDGTMGPIYFIRYSSHTAWNPSNTSYPFYTSSPDKGFVSACGSLLSDKLRTLQWRDEDRGLDGFYSMPDTVGPIEAVSYFHRRDGAVVGLWKKSHATLSYDDGASWSAPVVTPTFIMAGGKQWGQRTPDGKYAVTYNPIATQEYRYPLVMVTGEDGILFDRMGVIHGEVPLRRFYGRWKDFGPCYMRGITEGDQTPPGNDMWLAYSVTKEDIWISRIPCPADVETTGPIVEDFNGLDPGGIVPGWNLYAPRWARVSVVEFPSEQNKSLRLEDSDPYDYARAVRTFERAGRVAIRFTVGCGQQTSGRLDVELCDRHGSRPVRIVFDRDGLLKWDDGSQLRTLSDYRAGEWYAFEIDADTDGLGRFGLKVQGKQYLSDAQFAEASGPLERISFRTGEYRSKPDRTTPNQVPCEPLAGADVQVPHAVFHINELNVNTR